jgi:hypothetical protein
MFPHPRLRLKIDPDDAIDAMGRSLVDRQGGVGEGVEAARPPPTCAVAELSDLARRRSLLIAALVALRVKESMPELEMMHRW